VSDSKDLELDRLLTCGLEELIAAVRPMSAKDCERHARAILSPGLFNALSERDGADSAVKDVFSLSEGKPV